MVTNLYNIYKNVNFTMDFSIKIVKFLTFVL